MIDPTKKFEVVQEVFYTINNNMQQFEIDFHKDFNKLNLSEDLFKTTYILPKDISYVRDKMNYILSSIVLVLKKHGYDIKSRLSRDYDDNYCNLLDSYNEVFVNFFNPASERLKDSYDYDKLTTPTGLPYGIIASRVSDYIAYTISDTIYSISQEQNIINKYKHNRSHLINEIESIWSKQFEKNFMPAYKQCNAKALEEIKSHVMEELEICEKDYYEWEKNNPVEKKFERQDERLIKLEEANQLLKAAKHEIQQYKRPVLGLFGGDKKEIKDLKQKIKIYEDEIKGLSNNLTISNTPFMLGAIYIDNTNDYDFSRSFQEIKYDADRLLYIIYDDKIGEIGSLKHEFTKKYGTYRNLKGSGFTHEFMGLDLNYPEARRSIPDDYTYFKRQENHITYVSYYIYVHEN